MVRLFLGVCLIAWMATGCAFNPRTGEREVDAQRCAETVEAAKAAKLACQFIEGDDAEAKQNRERCVLGAQISLDAARLGCTFADDVDGSES